MRKFLPHPTMRAKRVVVGVGGLEPPTLRLSGVRSNHLSYTPPNIRPHDWGQGACSSMRVAGRMVEPDGIEPTT